MPYAFIMIGLVLIIVGVRNEAARFGQVIRSDLGNGNFLGWMAAIFIIAAIGAYKPLKPVSDGFLVLVCAVLLLANNGFFDRLREQIR